MDARRKEIDHLDGELSRLERQVTAECIEIGRRLAGLRPPGLKNEEILKHLQSGEALRRSIESSRGEILRVRNLARRVDALAAEIEETDRQRDTLAREEKIKLVELGTGGFAFFKTLPPADQERHRPLFEELLGLDREIERFQEELKSAEAGEIGKGFLERLRLKGRKVLLRGEINRIEKRKAAVYEQAGAKIAESDLARLAQGPLRRLCELAAARRHAAQALAAQVDRKVEEIESYRRELKSHGIDDRSDERVRENERRIAAIEKELDLACCAAGKIFLERDLRAEAADAPLAAKHDLVAGLRESIRKKRRQIHALKAETEIEELARKEKVLRARRKQLEEEMRVKERQIGVIDIEINMGHQRMEELRRVLAGEAPYAEAPALPPTPDFYAPSDTPPPPKAL